MINQGDLYWIDYDEPTGSGNGFRHPYVVVQNNLFNASAISTVVVCPLTGEIARAKNRGNILLKKGEANLPKECAVNVSQVTTVDKQDLEDYLGTLSQKRVVEILNGIRLVLDPCDPPEK